MTNLDIICNHFQLLLIAVSVFFKQLFSLAFLQREKKKKKKSLIFKYRVLKWQQKTVMYLAASINKE